MHNSETWILGENGDPLPLSNRDDNCSVATALAEQASYSLNLLSRDLEATLYNNADFVAAISRLAKCSRRSLIRILILDTGPVIQHGHRLVELSYRLSSLIKIRKIGHPYREFNEALLVVDETGYLHRKVADRYDAVANFADRREARRLTCLFNDIWERSTPDPELRRLHL